MEHIVAWLPAALVAGVLSLSASGGRGTAAPFPPPPENTPPPSLLLVTIDTWRWDYVGASGSGKVKTPVLDRLAREGVYEPEAVSPCPLTTPAHATIFTGLEVVRHGILDCTAYRLDPRIPTLAEAFRARGAATAAFVSSETLKRRYGLDRGFDRYDDGGMQTRGRGDWRSSWRDGAAVTEAVLAYLRGRGGAAPLFVWAHYYDLHLPYRPRPGLDALYPRDPYAAQAAFVDGEVGRLRAALEADRGRPWRIVIVGDHGEGLGDRNEDTHGMGLYRSTLHVPLILWPKPDRPLRLPRPWGLVDLAPTLREWFGLPGERRMDGDSLFGPGRRDRRLAAVTTEPTLLFGVAPFKAVRQGALHYLRDGAEELYDLASDPGQTRNMAGIPERRSDLGRLRALSDRAWPRWWPMPDAGFPSPMQGEEKRKLESLGYLAGSIPSEAALAHAPIAKVLLDHSQWERAREEAFRTGRRDALGLLLARLVAAYPASALLHKEYGVHLAQAGDLREAIRHTEAAVRLNPRDAAALINLGSFLLQDGQVGPAEGWLKQALEVNPESAMAHKNLGVLYAEYRGDPVQAVRHYRECLRLDPDIADAAAIRSYLAGREGAP
jgi:arylsulfatase A-like enzyme